jgi:hypothetical protein
MPDNATLNETDLHQFTGSETWYRHGLNKNILYTDGAKYIADHGGAYWLLDEIALAQRFDAKIATTEFQVWKLTVNPDHTARLVCEDGDSTRRNNGSPRRSKPGSPLAIVPKPLPRLRKTINVTPDFARNHLARDGETEIDAIDRRQSRR